MDEAPPSAASSSRTPFSRTVMLSHSPKMGILIAAGILAFLLLIALVIMKATAPAADAANGFFRTVASNGADAAWQGAAPAFRQHGTEPEWAAFVQANGLAAFRSASWNSRSVTGSTAHFSGKITLADGRKLPAQVDMRYTDTWRVSAISMTPPNNRFARP